MKIKYTHTNIIAADWRALAKFYEQVFGCVPVPPVRKQSDQWLAQGTGVPNASLEGVHLRLPGYGDSGPTLEIYQYEHMEEKPVSAPNRQGLGHLAFLVDDVSSVREKILQQGGKELGKLTEANVAGVGKLTFVYMTDPEENILEIQHWS
ncbi:VOC family protein [Tunicatimonas pelagia]|uniref:VOC family protein n=1 Tax=Tunicatimonas pelagia TaxID=931531 RepID=UPI002666CE2B|nr:VOC family protein [Tunicatimonas pelagia]WKN41418.1 VOC family protein [Tunicatimonas pelagia]